MTLGLFPLICKPALVASCAKLDVIVFTFFWMSANNPRSSAKSRYVDGCQGIPKPSQSMAVRITKSMARRKRKGKRIPHTSLNGEENRVAILCAEAAAISLVKTKSIDRRRWHSKLGLMMAARWRSALCTADHWVCFQLKMLKTAHPKPDFQLSSQVMMLLAKSVCHTPVKLLKLTADEITLSDTKWAGPGLNLCQLWVEWLKGRPLEVTDDGDRQMMWGWTLWRVPAPGVWIFQDWSQHSQPDGTF